MGKIEIWGGVGWGGYAVPSILEPYFDLSLR